MELISFSYGNQSGFVFWIMMIKGVALSAFLGWAIGANGLAFWLAPFGSKSEKLVTETRWRWWWVVPLVILLLHAVFAVWAKKIEDDLLTVL